MQIQSLGQYLAHGWVTCYDRNGEIVKRVTSADDGTVEDEGLTPDPSEGTASPNP